MRMAALSVVEVLVVAVALAAVGGCGPKTAAQGGSAGASSSSDASGSGSSSGAGQTGTGTSGTSVTTGTAASSDTGTAGATTGEPYTGPYHPCTKDEDCDDVVVDGVSGFCQILPEGTICRPPYECVPGGGDTDSGGPLGLTECPEIGDLSCSEEAMMHPEFQSCAFPPTYDGCVPGDPSYGGWCEIHCQPPVYPCPEPLVCATLFYDSGTCVWPP